MAEQTSFPLKTSEFLAWFKAQSGTTFHNDIEIQDLRGKGAGRGIGRFSSHGNCVKAVQHVYLLSSQ